MHAAAGSSGRLGDIAVRDSWNPSAPDTPDDVLAYDPNEHVYGPRVLAGPGADEGGGDTSPEGGAVRRTVTRSAYVPTLG